VAERGLDTDGRVRRTLGVLPYSKKFLTVVNRREEKAGLRRDAVRSQVIDVLEAQEIKETGNEEG
jgi:hypothetical protein